MELLKKGFNIIDKFRRQFYDGNYCYTWYEWFWIVRYAQAFTPRRAAKMLLVLNGEEEQGAGGRLSIKYIKNNINPVIQFWQDYFYYTSYVLSYLKGIHHLINRDPELKAEYNKILERDKKENDVTINKMLEEHTNSLQQKLLENDTSNVINNNSDYYLGTNNDDFKAIKVEQEGIRIYHSNKNYQKEMEEFKNGSRKENLRRNSHTHLAHLYYLWM